MASVTELITELLADASNYGGYCYGDYMINVLLPQAYCKEVKPFKTVDLLFPDDQQLRWFLIKQDKLIENDSDTYNLMVGGQCATTVRVQCGAKPQPLNFDTDNVVCQYQPKIKQFEQEYNNKLHRLEEQHKTHGKFSEADYEARVKSITDAHEELVKRLQGKYDIYFRSLDPSMVVCQLAAKIRDKQCNLLPETGDKNNSWKCIDDIWKLMADADKLYWQVVANEGLTLHNVPLPEDY